MSPFFGKLVVVRGRKFSTFSPLVNYRLLHRLIAPSTSSKNSIFAKQKNYEQKRTIVHKALLDVANLPPPWPYKEKGYEWYHRCIDFTRKRFNSNSKLIAVEGNIGAGKSTFAKELADELGMYHMPEFKMDDIMVDRYGLDKRDYYHMIPERFRYPDMKMFYADPGSPQTACMQYMFYFCRFEQYMNAVAHILNTGQGVVLERTPHADFVFTNAMYAKNYITKNFFDHYLFYRKFSLHNLALRPHLIVFLDSPVERCLENIKKRNRPEEVNSDVIDYKYLKTIEDSYKDYLKEQTVHSEVIVYDGDRAADVDGVVEDIEKMDFEFYEWHRSDRFKDWLEYDSEFHWQNLRIMYTSKLKLLDYALRDYFHNYDVGELYIVMEDLEQYISVIQYEMLKSPYSYGYIRERGDPAFNGWQITRGRHYLPENWFDYFYKEAFYDTMNSPRMSLDRNRESYNPLYVRLTEHQH